MGVPSLPDRLCASRDGRYLLIHNPTEVQLWHTMPPRLLKTIAGNPWITGADISADGVYLAHASVSLSDYTMQVSIRRTADGALVRQLQVEEAGEMALSPDGRLVFVLSDSGVKAYRASDGRMVGHFPIDIYLFAVIAVSGNGNYLAVGGQNSRLGYTWRLWRLSDGALIAGEDSPDYAGTIFALRFSPDSRTLYLAIEDVIRMIDTETGADRGNWQAPRMFSVLRFCRNGTEIATSDAQGLSFYSVQDGTLVRRVEVPKSDYSVEALSEDGRWYALYPYLDGLGIFSLSDGGIATPVLTIPSSALPDRVYFLQWVDDGSSLYLKSGDKLLRMRISDGSIESLRERIYRFSISSDGRYLVYSDYSDNIFVEDAVQAIPLYSPDGGSVFQILEAAQLLMVARYYESYIEVRLHDLPTGDLRRAFWLTRPPSDYLDEITASPDASVFAIRLVQERRTDLYGLYQKNSQWELPFGGHPLLFSPDGRWVAIGSDRLAMAKVASGEMRLQGRVTIAGWAGVLPNNLRYILRDASTGQVVGEGRLGLVPATGFSVGKFLIPQPLGDHQLTIYGAPFLKRSVQVLSESVNIVLYPGDIDGDNEVTLFDFGRMVAAFGSVAGEDEYDVNADLDGDGEVTLWDFGLLVERFGMIGDE